MQSHSTSNSDFVVGGDGRLRWVFALLGLLGGGMLYLSWAGTFDSSGFSAVWILFLLLGFVSLTPWPRTEVEGFELRSYLGSRLKARVDARDIERLAQYPWGLKAFFAGGASININEHAPNGYRLRQFLSILLEARGTEQT